MRKWLYVIAIYLSVISCERRELTYNYDPTVTIAVSADWSDMDETPTGMSVYCYPEHGGSPTIAIANISTMESSLSVELEAGIYNILVFNQIPSDFGTISFEGMSDFETASINAVSTTSAWAKSVSDGELVREPESLAAATYLDLEITEEAVRSSVEMKSKATKAEDLIYKTIKVDPKVVIKVTRVRLRISGIHNHRSTRATLYGMASGYNFSEQKSHATMTTHVMEDWDKTIYDYDNTEGEIESYITCFGLPEQTTNTRADKYSDWPGKLDVDILLVDNSTTMSESILLSDKISTSSNSDVDADLDTDLDVDLDASLDVSVDINVDLGFDTGDSGEPSDDLITLPDVTPEGSTSGGSFDATVDGWGDNQIVDIPI